MRYAFPLPSLLFLGQLGYSKVYCNLEFHWNSCFLLLLNAIFGWFFSIFLVIAALGVFGRCMLLFCSQLGPFSILSIPYPSDPLLSIATPLALQVRLWCYESALFLPKFSSFLLSIFDSTCFLLSCPFPRSWFSVASFGSALGSTLFHWSNPELPHLFSIDLCRTHIFLLRGEDIGRWQTRVRETLRRRLTTSEMVSAPQRDKHGKCRQKPQGQNI